MFNRHRLHGGSGARQGLLDGNHLDLALCVRLADVHEPIVGQVSRMRKRFVAPVACSLKMTAERLRVVFWIDAVYSTATGVIFALGSWDGLYHALELPQGKPAIFTQVLGAVLLGVAYLLWLGTRTPTLALPLARAAAIMNALAAGIVIAWLIHGGLGIGTLGKVELTASAVLMSALAVCYLVAGVRHGGYGPEPPPPPAP